MCIYGKFTIEEKFVIFWGKVRAGTVLLTPSGVPPLFKKASAPGGPGGWGSPLGVSGGLGT